MTEELKPCPFCQGKAFQDTHYDKFGCIEGSIACDDCGARGIEISDIADGFQTDGLAIDNAIKLWNTRPAPVDVEGLINDVISSLERERGRRATMHEGQCIRLCIDHLASLGLIKQEPCQIEQTYLSRQKQQEEMDARQEALDNLINSYPQGHISMRRLGNGKISITTYDGIGGGTGKVDHYSGTTAIETIRKALEGK